MAASDTKYKQLSGGPILASGIGNPASEDQSWVRVSKITLRLAPVRLFQTVSRLALRRIFQKKICVISLSGHRVLR